MSTEASLKNSKHYHNLNGAIETNLSRSSTCILSLFLLPASPSGLASPLSLRLALALIPGLAPVVGVAPLLGVAPLGEVASLLGAASLVGLATLLGLAAEATTLSVLEV